MKQFFKFMFASMLGNILLVIIIIFILIGMASSLSKKEEIVVKDNSVLTMSLDAPITDRSPKNPFESIDFGPFGSFKIIGLNDILLSIKKAEKDDRIKGIYLNLNILPSGYAVIEDIRNALLEFKESGKFIITYGEILSQKAYYLASVSDKIIINPEGMMDFRGINSSSVFIKGTLEKLDIEPQTIRGESNDFKSAVEIFMRDEMSDADKLQTKSYIDAVWNNYLQNVSASRSIEATTLDGIANLMKIKRPEEAVEMGLIDAVMYKDQVLEELMNTLGEDNIEDINYISIKKYKDARLKDKKKRRSKDKIAVIYALGEIGGGEGDDQTIGSERLSKAIRKARLDSNVQAIVLRINSPGGSALASEVIWREADLASKIKPVVASFSDLAASGGYYIACTADTIVAQPNTLTGSIGVFGVMFNMQGFFNNKLGVTFDNVKTNDHADFGDMTRPMTAFEKEVIEVYIDDVYNTFISHVAEGRNMDVAMVDSLGRGRIWSGKDARDIGLVDVLGGLKESVEIAAYMAGLEDYRIVSLPKQKNPIEQIFDELKTSTSEKLIKEQIGENHEIFKQLKSLQEMDGPQARLPILIQVD